MKTLLRLLVLLAGVFAAQGSLAQEVWYRYFPHSATCVELWQAHPLRKQEVGQSPAQLFYGIFKIPLPGRVPFSLPNTPAEIVAFLNASHAGTVALKPLAQAAPESSAKNTLSDAEQASLLAVLNRSAYLLSGTYRPNPAAQDRIEVETLGLVLVTRTVCEWVRSQ
jgi:hypothetical protein